VAEQEPDPQQRILEAAGELFAAHGFAAVSVRDICKHELTGVNVSAVNYYFRSKDHLYHEVVRYACEKALAEVPLPTWPDGVPAAQRLRDYIRSFIDRVVQDHEPRWLCPLVMREMLQPTPACEDFVRHFARPHFEILRDILADLLPADTPPLKRQMIGFSIIGQCLHYRQGRPVIQMLVGPETFEQFTPALIADHVAEFTLAALGLAAPLSRSEETPA
jgi:AcrR family transcriptional regulator